MSLEGLDDLLEDIDDQPKRAAPKRAAPAKKAHPFPASAPKKNDEDEWGDLDDLDPKPVGRGGLSNQTPTDSKLNSAAKPFGFGGVDGLKKETMTKEEEDEWGLDASGPNKGGRLLGRKHQKKEDEDDFDALLGDLEAKRGVEEKKKEEKKNPFSSRPKTANVPNHWQSVEDDQLNDENLVSEPWGGRN